jgi:GxxExxY protein
MIYEKETSLLRKGLFEVQNQIGLGRHEEIYHQAFDLRLNQESIPHTSKEPHPLLFDGETAHTLYPDFVIWNKITIELKAVPRRLHAPEYVQIFNYLKRRNDKLGLLVNMGLDRVQIDRIVYDPPAYELSEDWTQWNDRISEADRDTGLRIRTILQKLYETHQTGYGTEVLEKLIQFGLQKQGLHSISSPTGPALFQDRILGAPPLTAWLSKTGFYLSLQPSLMTTTSMSVAAYPS